MRVFQDAQVKHRERIEYMAWTEKCEVSDIAQFHIFDLASYGISKQAVVQDLAVVVQQLDGLVLVEYPIFPSQIWFRNKQTSVVHGTVDGNGCDADEAWSDDDFGCDGDGKLPDCISESYEKLSADQRAANLSQDHFKILQEIAFSTTGNKYPKPVSFICNDSVRHGVLLIPMGTVRERRGTSTDIDLSGLVASAIQQVGCFTDVSPPLQFVNTSTNAMAVKRIRRILEDEEAWECEVPMVKRVGQVLNKILRCQHGSVFYANLF